MARIVNITTYRNGKYKDEDYGKKYEFDELLRIGRGELADIRMGSHFVSECHCFIINYKEKYYLGDCSTYGTWHPISRGKNFVVEEKSKKLESIVGAGNLGGIMGIIGADLNELMKSVEGEGRIIREVRKMVFKKLQDNNVREKIVEGGKVKLLNEGDVIGIYSVWELQFFEK